MKTTGAKRVWQRGQVRGMERAQGQGRSVLHLSAQRASQQAIGDVRRLPSLPNTATLQNAAGEFLFLAGYSDPAGPDVVGTGS